MAGSQLLGIAVLMIGIWRPSTCFAQTSPKDAAASERNSLRVFLESFDSDLKDRFFAAFVDLNGDGKPEAIVHLTSTAWCGSGGCTTLILVRDGNSWRILTMITITRPPIRVLTTKFNGWRSIVVWVRGGGILPGYEAELRFDGKTYPTNPSIPPAIRTAGKAKGEIVVPSSAAR
jgi:hypothetical protein